MTDLVNATAVAMVAADAAGVDVILLSRARARARALDTYTRQSVFFPGFYETEFRNF